MWDNEERKDFCFGGTRVDSFCKEYERMNHWKI